MSVDLIVFVSLLTSVILKYVPPTSLVKSSCILKKYFDFFFQISHPAVIYIVEGHEKASGCERKHSIYFQDVHRKCRNGMPEFKKGTAFLPSPFPER